MQAQSNILVPFFIIMKKIREDRRLWESFKMDLYRLCMDPNVDIPDFQRQMVYDYRGGLYETPKVFIDGYAYNDGSWKKFNTGCMYKTGYRGMMICWDKKSIIDCLYAYMCFLKKIGIDDSKVFGYFTVVYMLDINILSRMISEVIEKDVGDICCDYDDERKYVISPDLLRCKTKGDKVKIQRKKDKEIDWKRIEELYDSSKTNIQNLMEFRKNGLNISERTFQRWKKSRKQA